jgi:hypothetical protein
MNWFWTAQAVWGLVVWLAIGFYFVWCAIEVTFCEFTSVQDEDRHLYDDYFK